MRHLQKYFAAIGARLEVIPLTARDRRIGRQWMTRRMNDNAMLVDVKRDNGEERFALTHHSDADIKVIDVKADLKHLLLTTKPKDHPATRTFLCGHDESHWFVAAIPERTKVRYVNEAMDALKPEEVWQSIRDHALPESEWNLRRTSAFVRQGEWFFIPRPEMNAFTQRNVRREPLSRGFGSQWHWCDELFRLGGQTVWVSARFPSGLTQSQYQALSPEMRKTHRWRQMRRDARAFARGYVRHPDHAPIWLDGWHQVAMNTEGQASAMRHVVFLD